MRPNPEGRKIEKPEGRIYDEMAELLKNWKAKFYPKAEYIVIVIPTQYIKA